MTKEEQNQIIKDALMRNLRKNDSIPDNLGDLYENWLTGKIRQASEQLVQQQGPQEQGQQQEAS